MKILEEIKESGLENLIEKYSLETNYHEDGRVILNYSQINSPKHEEVVKECRGLVLHTGNLVARSFPRFFNLGEVPGNGDTIDWASSFIQEKVDGSLILLYFWNNRWHVNTRGSFGNGETNGRTWRSLVEECVELDSLNPSLIYVCELCSPYNQVVRFYEKPTLYLLTAFRGEQEIEVGALGDIYKEVKGNVDLPQLYSFHNSQEILSFLEEKEESDKTFEGVVVRDASNFRLKIKSKSYLRIHRLSSNGSVVNVKNLVPIILKGEDAEIGAYWPHFLPKIEEVKGVLAANYKILDNFLFTHLDEPSQKKFAEKVLKEIPHLSALAFKVRKGVPLKDIWENSADYLVNHLF